MYLLVEGQDEPIGFGLRDGRFNVRQVAETLRVSPLLIQIDAGGPFVVPAARQEDGLTERQFATNTEHTALLVKATAGVLGLKRDKAVVGAELRLLQARAAGCCRLLHRAGICICAHPPVECRQC